MLSRILNRADVKEFLHEVVLDERFNSKKCPETYEKTTYPKTEYSLILMMDALIKYAILFDTDDLVDEYILQLRRFMKKCESHRDLAEGINKLLGRITAVILKIDLEEVETPSAKRKILTYIYEKYIINGYVFHSFPSIYQNRVEENGLDPLEYKMDLNKLKEVKEIIRKHNIKEVITKDLTDTSYITITDSPALAYHYALSSPSYLSELTATSTQMENEKIYEREAYLHKDFQKAEENIEKLCSNLGLSNSESTVFLETFVEEWKRLDITNSTPMIAFIKRESLNKNYLKDYRKILETCEKEELSYSIEQIMTSRIDNEKRYTPIKRQDIKIERLLSYKEIYYNDDDFKEELPLIDQKIIKEEMPKRVNIRNEVVNAYGNASILALLGVLLIALGATITILLAIYKG